VISDTSPEKTQRRGKHVRRSTPATKTRHVDPVTVSGPVFRTVAVVYCITFSRSNHHQLAMNWPLRSWKPSNCANGQTDNDLCLCVPDYVTHISHLFAMNSKPQSLDYLVFRRRLSSPRCNEHVLVETIAILIGTCMSVKARDDGTATIL